MTGVGGVTAIPSPNIWGDARTYEIENLGVDPDGIVDTAIGSVADLSGSSVLDIGCGTGFHLPGFAQRAARVLGVEPHPPLVRAARDRAARARAGDPGLAPIAVVQGGAQALPLGAGSVDLAHARWAYFFGPGCEPGLAELARVVRPGGGAVVVDIDPSRSTFGGWFRSAYPSYDAAAVRRFWLRRGWTPTDVTLRWAFSSHEDFVAVLGLELPPTVVASAVREAPTATGVDYGATVWWRRF